jgi:hypothetical protein
VKHIILLLLIVLSLNACMTLEPSEVRYCIAHEEAAKDWNQTTLDAFVSNLEPQNAQLISEMKEKNFSQDKIKKVLLAAQYAELQICQGKMARQRYLIKLPASKEFAERIYKNYAHDEQELFRRRTGGKALCSGDVAMFVYGFHGEPEKGCVYPYASGSLVALQSSGAGILAIHPDMIGGSRPNTIFIYANSTDKNLADRERLEPGFFAYEGVYRYQSLLGQRSVHAFKRLNSNLLDDIWFFK